MNRQSTRLSPGLIEKLGLAAIVLLALVVRVAIARMDHVLQGDEGAYVWLGKTLVSGGGYQFFGKPELHYTPFYPLVSGIAWLVVRDLELASKACYVLFGALTLAPVYLLARRMYGNLAGHVAALLVAVAPALTSYVYFWGSMTEPLYFFLLFWGIYTGLLVLEDGRWPMAFATGILLSLAYLTRPEGLIYVALVAGYILLARLLKRCENVWRTLALAGAIVLAFSLVSLPYWTFLRGHLGYWSLTGKTWIAFVGHKALVEGELVAFDRIVWGLDSSGLEVMYHSMDKFQHYSMLDEILSDPRLFAMDVLHNLRQMDGVLLSKRVFPFFLIPLLSLGLFRSRWGERRRQQELYLLLLALAPSMGLVVFTIDLRFYHGIVIIFLIWVAYGLVEMGRWLQETVGRAGSRWERGMVVGGSLILAIYFCAIQPAIAHDGLMTKRFHYKEVGEWLDAHSLPHETVMSRGAIPAIYANRAWVPFPHAEYDDVLRYARSHGVDYLVLNSESAEVMRPQVAFLVDRERLPAEWEWAYSYEGRSDTTVVLRLVN